MNLVKPISYLSLCISAICQSTAFASQEADDASAEALLERIQIKGIRSSLTRSVSLKKEADQVLEVITAEDIGLFPDQNIAESLQRVAGVAMVRAFGEGERISIRGTEPSQNITMLNGQNIASEDWWFIGQPQRSFNYTVLPSEIISSLEVQKSPTADQNEGSLGGSVDIKTHLPFDLPDAHTIVMAKAQYSDLSEETDPQLFFMHNWINEEEDFGALVSFTRHERTLRRDGIESGSWVNGEFERLDNGYLLAVAPDARPEPEHFNVLYPNWGGSAYFTQERIRTTGTLALQWQLNDWDWQFNSLVTQLESDNVNQGFMWFPTVKLVELPDDQFTVVDDVIRSISYPENDTYNAGLIAIDRHSESLMYSMQLIAERDVDGGHYEYQLGYSHSETDKPSEYLSIWLRPSATDVQMDRENIIVDYAYDPADPNNWPLSGLDSAINDAEDSEIYGQADFEFFLQDSLFEQVKFGFKFRHHNRTYKRDSASYDVGIDATVADFEQSLPNNFLDELGSADTVKDFSIVDVDAVFPYFPEGDYKPDHASSFEVEEAIFAAYVRFDFNFGNVSGNIGTRAVSTHVDSSGYALERLGDEEYIWQTEENNYFNLLPSFNLKLPIKDDLQFRFSYAHVLSRPEYSQLSNAIDYQPTNGVVVAGNPQLDPLTAHNYEFGAEWYWNDYSYASATAFYRGVSEFIEESTTLRDYNGEQLLVQEPDNTLGGSYEGIELTIQREIIDGWGVIANYTFMQGDRYKESEVPSLPGLSKEIYNISGFYDDDTFQARLSYNFRSNYATGAAFNVTDDYGQWDFSFKANINENIALMFDVLNITDETLFLYNKTTYAPTNIYHNGRRFFTGIRAEF
ncbi:TonB-dependent receptor [Catenovulum sp. SM1970]|uniref:TonB-dependent receptor n=1 Tax=Marinifaba aquimaris TaxID=2741323 RepID=UPI0015740524|nr:TonB-dependent receptor [Marinifaba aquimaris]NTS76147.1 TonB-dependent receptor [Marinifaba aquimaris]